MQTKPFNAADYDTECLGFFEEFIDHETHKMLGIRFLEKTDRPLGSDGMLDVVLTEPLHLLKGYKQVPVIVKASKQFPVRVTSMVQVLCGKLKNQTWKHEQKNIA